MGVGTDIKRELSAINKNIDTSVSGAIHQSIKQLASPIQELKNIADNSSKKTEELSSKLVFWTRIMAFAIIGQILAIIGQIVVIIFNTNSN